MNGKKPFKRQRILQSHRGSQQRKVIQTFIDKNIKTVQDNHPVKSVDGKFQHLVGMNIPKIQLECSFSRKELYNIYTKFKALSKISMTNFPELMTDIGVEKSVFMNGLK